MNINNNNNNMIFNKRTMGGNSPLLMYQPFSYVVFATFHSPFIIASIMVALSFTFQNFKGLIFLAFLIGVSILRNFIYMLNGASPLINDKTICTSIQYSKYGNPTFSAFVFAFTIMYISIPMFSNGSVNYWIFSGLIFYFFLDIFVKAYKGCIVSPAYLFLNVLLGLASSALIVTLMYFGGSGKFLFFNEVQSSKQMCSMPKNQTFKCSVYKNGELISNL
jgi:hypothetical protein